MSDTQFKSIIDRLKKIEELLQPKNYFIPGTGTPIKKELPEMEGPIRLNEGL